MPVATAFDIPIVHKVNEFYKVLYELGKKAPKRDRFGIHEQIETLCVQVLSLSVEAALTPKDQKREQLRVLRIKLEVLKYLIRSGSEVGAYDDKAYLMLQERLQEISRMAGGWLRYSS